MAGFLPGKMKRKDLEEVYGDFSEFSLSSPARKIRRLDAELPPIMEEEDSAVPVVFEFEQQQLPRDLMSGSSSMPESGSTMTDAVPVPALNEERSLVLYKPVDAQLLWSPAQSNVSFRVSSDLIHGLKNQAFQSGNQMRVEDKSAVSSNCLAVVPWVPNKGSVVATGSGDPIEVQSKVSQEPMEAEQIESVSMEVEEERDQAEQASIDGGAGGEGFHQWQQHCMTPQLPPNPSTPVMWSW
ncbi:uncharacterized protein LOC103715535 isoform X1 [Phoenix dactylifera]|uniref:Uncharacterized protein LOC103715535 isoform X1 n=2 Tax=Phoenix dactylifera TaxID=42345 RepID=A0A8B7MVJ7_PHODC|nr:uncharacterized protein LOC103715535 isoform X1 [Phoenix dactylifera]